MGNHRSIYDIKFNRCPSIIIHICLITKHRVCIFGVKCLPCMCAMIWSQFYAVSSVANLDPWCIILCLQLIIIVLFYDCCFEPYVNRLYVFIDPISQIGLVQWDVIINYYTPYKYRALLCFAFMIISDFHFYFLFHSFFFFQIKSICCNLHECYV